MGICAMAIGRKEEGGGESVSQTEPAHERVTMIRGWWRRVVVLARP